MSGALPWTGSNSEGLERSGLMLPHGAMPIVPVQAGPRSDRMSPNRFDATTTSKRSGFSTNRSEEHTSELQSLMRISYAVFCLKKKHQIPKQSLPTQYNTPHYHNHHNLTTY